MIRDLQVLISALNADPKELIDKMNLSGDAVLVNQCDEEGECILPTAAGEVQVISSLDRGVGLSRNLALENASAPYILFADDDIRYYDNYEDKVLHEFEKIDFADVLIFNVDVCKERSTYKNYDYERVTWMKSGRYPTYSFACKLDSIREAGIDFSPYFGGGAKYGCGEDSLFLMDCLRAGLNVFCVPVTLGREEVRPSTWFHGYTEKYFTDKGVLYRCLYGALARPVAARFVWKHRKTQCTDISPLKAYKLMVKGIKEAKKGL